MDVRIGVTQSPREIELTLADDTDREEIKARVEAALAGEGAVLWLVDRKGREVAVAGERIAYVELGSEADSRPMGFSS